MLCFRIPVRTISYASDGAIFCCKDHEINKTITPIFRGTRCVAPMTCFLQAPRSCTAAIVRMHPKTASQHPVPACLEPHLNKHPTPMRKQSACPPRALPSLILPNSHYHQPRCIPTSRPALEQPPQAYKHARTREVARDSSRRTFARERVRGRALLRPRASGCVNASCGKLDAGRRGCLAHFASDAGDTGEACVSARGLHLLISCSAQDCLWLVPGQKHAPLERSLDFDARHRAAVLRSL